MDMTGEQRIPAPQKEVWEALNDVEILRLAIPGCQEVDKKSDTEFTAKVKLSIGPVKASFSGEVTLSDIDAPNGYTLTGQGSGGVAGFGKGEAKVSLREEDGETIITYTAHASVGGKLAQIGQRLIDSTAKKLAGQFFKSFEAYFVEKNKETDAGSVAPAQPATPNTGQNSANSCQILFWGLAAAGLTVLWILHT
jgi:uncharacterized protein